MPLFVAAAIPIWTAAASGAGAAAAGIYGAHKQGQAADQAAQVQAKSNADAIAIQQQQIAQEKAQFDAQQQFAQEQFNQQQALKAPYRQAGQAALSKLGDVLGVSFQGYGTGSNAAPAATGIAAAPTAGGNSAPAATGTAAQIINNWQAAHSPTEGTTGLISALKAGGVDAAPYLYGSTPSGNEISLNGQKYKVIAGENSSTPSWYVAGTPDSAGTSSAAAAAPRTTLASLGINPMTSVTQAPYTQVVPFANAYGSSYGSPNPYGAQSSPYSAQNPYGLTYGAS